MGDKEKAYFQKKNEKQKNINISCLPLLPLIIKSIQLSKHHHLTHPHIWPSAIIQVCSAIIQYRDPNK